MKVCKDCKDKGIKSCDHELAEGLGKFREILHPRDRGGKFRATLAQIEKNPYHGIEYPDKGESKRIGRLRELGYVEFDPHGGNPDMTGGLRLTATGKRFLHGEPAGFVPNSSGYSGHFGAEPQKRGVGPRAAAVIEKHFAPSGKKFVPYKSGFGGTWESPASKPSDAVLANLGTVAATQALGKKSAAKALLAERSRF